ncbi:hypothetical protein EC9_49340 [Rosistilla ulvae]|uniref:PPi-type phosphoenolpyruvate carboxykinase lobe 2 domain-containing protein n=1 Tax=Rosistilla ulvae TaxID=1930277 RepID=A0A517M751_9BACT|nr:hypothetical protein [Rosistilla ulvae]QDS90718.1 hypothetical protein EC9_49340 [Rosistilla ulvae]
MPSPNSSEPVQRSLGWDRAIATDAAERAKLHSYIALQLAAAGLQPPEDDSTDHALAQYSVGFLQNLREKNRLLADYRAPVDRRIEAFLTRHFAELKLDQPLRLPSSSLVLDRHGVARELSLPARGDHFENDFVNSYRVHNGVLHNPRFDRRTTAGTFHIVEGGPAIAGSKRTVPKAVFAKLFQAAMSPPDELMSLPYTADSDSPARCFVSLLLRPLVCPAVAGCCTEKRMEVRFYAPGALVSNLDFVESIFGNAGDALVPENDAGLDVEHWTGHTGCVILAPHLERLTKKELGLPHISEATPLQIADRMCWEDESECYNDGSPFKAVCRTDEGVVVTLIADNYYGYCKKEVKSQISYSANLLGGVEEEHAGGAMAFASYSLGDEFQVDSRRYNNRTFEDIARDYSEFIDVKPEGYGVDRLYPEVIYIPENAKVTLLEQCVKWQHDGREQRIPLLPENVYIAPSGYKIRLDKHPAAPSWRLVGTAGEGLVCHKPCTVSGGGKSEISKSLRDYMLYGPIFVMDLERDFATLDELFSRDYSGRWHPEYKQKPSYSERSTRKVLDSNRSLGSMIKLLTPSPDYNDDYNAWLASIPNHIYAMAFIIKRFSKPEWEGNWREHFSVDIVNGELGHQLKHGRRNLVGTYLKVGLDGDQWRTFKLRQDFIAAAKVQMEDDITASVVIPGRRVGDVGPAVAPAESYKFVENCEFRLFQRPDDAVHRGLDKQTELDMSRPGNFLCNYEPKDRAAIAAMLSSTIELGEFSDPMREMLIEAGEQDSGYVVSSAHPRMIDGKPSKNPRYLQDRLDLTSPLETYVAHRGMRLHRALPMDQPVHMPVAAVLSGRRNNPPDPEQGIKQLAVYSPLHYQELPELFMDYICSLTGKSPSTTGAGSEGALTKGPFNNMPPTVDLNDVLVSMILTGLSGFSTPAGHIGPRFEVGHDISLLIPEIWCRLGPKERDPQRMIEQSLLEPIADYVDSKGEYVPASRLGYRITQRFVVKYFGRVFDNPGKVFSDEILQPELQDPEAFAEGVRHIADAQQKVAQRYFDDGTWQLASPPIQAILSIMATGEWYGHDANSPVVREMFTKEYLLASDWYQARLQTKQTRDVALWKRHIEYIASQRDTLASFRSDIDLDARLAYAQQQLEIASSPQYLKDLVGTLGADPMLPIEARPSKPAAELA